MRKLPLLLLLLLLSLLLLAAAASAHASVLALPRGTTALAAPAADGEAEAGGETEGEAGEGEGDEGDEGEGCGAEAGEPCEEEEEEEEEEECLLEGASAMVSVSRSGGHVRLTVRYRASEPTAVAIDASLRGRKGSLHLGRERVRFHRAGTYRDRFSLGPRQMPKALAARELEVRLRAVGAPAGCELDLATRPSRRAR